HMDEERKAVAVAVGIQPRGIRGWLNQVYDVPMATLHEMVQNTPAYQNTPEIPNRSPAPKTLFNRYLLEEVPLRAVPTVEIARIFRIPTPLYEHMIDESCKLTGIDFWKTGRTLKDMGLDHSEVRGWKNRYSD
ncbi:MAG: NAD/NADP octopine/nopaline dehydrogenase family protein, partial [Nanoarchaeota archaeon]|nr:NAD/NADP octopine/nopaline dehydrogenase family protein [Nanoarchaeota archaeon]